VSRRKRDFTFRQLSSFVAAARSGSFALAADRLGVSQPAISDHIGALEANLGHALFERRRGTTPRLTAQGLELLDRAETLLRTSQAMRGDDRPADAHERVRIRLSIGPRLREVYLKPLLPRLYAEHPDVEIELVPVLPLRDVPAALRKGAVDLLFYTVGAVPDGIGPLLAADDVALALVAAPELAGRIARGETALETVPFILTDSGANAERWIERQLAAVGVVPDAPFRYVEFADVVQTMAESGFGASVLMREQVEAAILAGRLAAIDVPIAPMKRIVVRAATAPRATDAIARSLIRAWQGGP
jgi:LysR family transcriptional regulator, low CO2-responsive transcriptional regulator